MDSYYSESLISIIAIPEGYKGASVAVMGYLKLDEESYLYATKDHAEIGDVSSSVKIHVEINDREFLKSECNNMYGWVTGLIYPVTKHSRRLKLQSIASIKRLEGVKNGEFCIPTKP